MRLFRRSGHRASGGQAGVYERTMADLDDKDAQISQLLQAADRLVRELRRSVYEASEQIRDDGGNP